MEKSWRRQQVDNQELEQKAVAFLTSVQLKELSEYHAQQLRTQQSYVESARAEAGMDPKIPQKSEAVEEARTLIEALLQVELKLTVNRESTTVTRMVRNGEPFTVEAAQGLIVEATPVMYEDDSLELQLKYYEDGATGRRRLSGGVTSASYTRHPDGSLRNSGTAFGSGGSIVTGRKGYAVDTALNADKL
jgi:hypothetical protein